MLSWFSEDATFPFISGMILAVVFFLLFVTSRNKVMLYLSIGIALLVGGLFACEQLIVTDREEIAAVVSDLAVQIEDNNVAGVVKHLSPKHQETINRAKAEMPSTISLHVDCRELKNSKMPKQILKRRKLHLLSIFELVQPRLERRFQANEKLR